MKRKPTSRKSRTDWPRIRAMKDEDIVIEDENPEWTPEMFARAVLRKGFKVIPRKKLVSLRIDEDVLAWFRGRGRGYQSQMNALLRAYMEAHKNSRRA